MYGFVYFEGIIWWKESDRSINVWVIQYFGRHLI